MICKTQQSLLQQTRKKIYIKWFGFEPKKQRNTTRLQFVTLNQGHFPQILLFFSPNVVKEYFFRRRGLEPRNDVLTSSCKAVILGGGQRLQPCNFLTDNNARWPIDRFYIGYIVFAGRGHQKIIEVMMLIKITGESFKFMGSKSI